jgi:hypothetical protein
MVIRKGVFMNAARWILIVALVVALGTAGQVAFADKVAPSGSSNTGANLDPPGNLLLNNSFQSGDFTDWNLSGNTGFTGVSNGFDGYTGQDADGFFAFLGAIGSDAVISQTVSDSSGQAYTVSFWYNANGTGPSDFNASWDGTSLLSLPSPTSTNGWTLFSFTVTGTGSDTLSFGARNDPDYDALDNVAVIATTTPEPGTLALLGLGLTALIGIARRKVRV